MSNLFDSFMQAVVSELGSQVVQIAIGGAKALLASNDQVTISRSRYARYSPNLLEIYVMFHPDHGIPMKHLWLESSGLLTPRFALQIRNSVAPWYTGPMYVEGGRPSSQPYSYMPETGRLYWINRGVVEEAPVVAWPPLSEC